MAGVRDAASPRLGEAADAFAWIGPGELDRLVAFLKGLDVPEAVLLGKVEHRTFVRDGAPGTELATRLSGLPDRRPATLLRFLIDALEAKGIEVLDPGFLLRPFFCPPGRLGRIEPSAEAGEDIDFGWPLAKRLADLDIGQTVVVKRRAVVAVEGMEGTDETIQRSRRLAGPGIVVLKVGRTLQDRRIDVPAVGLGTVRALVAAQAAALCFEAATTPFFRKEDSLALAESSGLAVLAR